MLERAARGELPDWAEATPPRRAHIARVAALLDEWAAALGKDETERMRWKAAGYLHDALRDAPPERLRPWLDSPFRELPPGFLHGPATAARLDAEGIRDDELLDAIRYHTLGHAGLRTLGRFLVAADFLEPGRPKETEWRAELRERMTRDPDGVVREIARYKIEKSLHANARVRPELLGLWNALAANSED